MKYLRPLQLYRQSLKSTGPLMGLSVGKTQLGLSMSGNTKTNVPYRSSMTLLNDRNRLSTVQSLIARHSVSGLVIAYPFKMEEEFPTAGVEAKNFVDDLNNTIDFDDMKYTLWEETFATKNWPPRDASTPDTLYLAPYKRTDVYASYEILKEYLEMVILSKHIEHIFTYVSEVPYPK